MNTQLSRREFLLRLTVAGTAALLLPAALGEAEAASTQFVPAGNVADFKPGVYRAVTLAHGETVLVRRMLGKAVKFQALSARCTHKGCLVSWIAGQKQFRCPCHGGRFDADGRNIAGPPPAPLPRLATRVVKGIVLVSLPPATVYGAPDGGKIPA